jgi:sulfite exporter TauE/SafE
VLGMNLTAVLITGLLAGGVSCAAVQGGLLAGLITRQRATGGAQPETAAPSALVTLREDLTPVASFLAGKLLSHSLLGGLLGAVGAAVQLSVGIRTWLQITAGLLIITFGLAQLGVPGFRRIVIQPPVSWTRLVRARARSQTAFAPAVLGLATILIPCGVTLSVEALALASGSAPHGALIMAVFVVGTSPLFTLIGYAARKLAHAWSGRLAMATGVVVVTMGLLTLNGGLELAGSPLAASKISKTLGFDSTPAVATNSTVTLRGGHQEVVITAGRDGYTPANAQLTAGVPTTLIVHSDGAAGCLRSFTIPNRDEQYVLPATGDTRIELGTLSAGQLSYACGMGMFRGVLTVI